MRRATVSAIFLIVIPLLGYIPSMNGGYLWDDDHYITLNKDLRDFSGLVKIWTRLGRASGGTPQYYPLTHTTFWIEYQLHGLRPLPFHLLNVLLHGLSAILVWRILDRLRVRGSWLIAAIWVIHPVNVESVAWISERKNVLSGIFFFLAIWQFLKWARIGGNEDGGLRMEAGAEYTSFLLHLPSSTYVLSLACFLLALLSKTTVSVLPGILFLILWWKERLSYRNTLALLPFLLIGIPLGLLTAHVERKYVGAIGPDWDLSFAQRILIAGRAAWFYLGKLIWPTRLSFMYQRWMIDAHSVRQWLYPLTAAGLILASLPRPALRTGVIGFFVLLFPALGFFNTYPMRFSFVADHFQYLASLPAIAVMVVLLGKSLPRYLRQPLAAAVLSLLFICTWNRAFAFRDLITLWRDTIAANPSSWMAKNNLGMALIERAEKTHSPDDLDEAAALFQQTLVLRPQHEWAHYGLGKVAELRGDTADAQAEFERETLAAPEYATTYYELGMLAWSAGDWATAERNFERSRELDSLPASGHYIPIRLPQTRLMLARLYRSQGRMLEAQHMLDEAREIQAAQ